MQAEGDFITYNHQGIIPVYLPLAGICSSYVYFHHIISYSMVLEKEFIHFGLPSSQKCTKLSQNMSKVFLSFPSTKQTYLDLRETPPPHPTNLSELLSTSRRQGFKNPSSQFTNFRGAKLATQRYFWKLTTAKKCPRSQQVHLSNFHISPNPWPINLKSKTPHKRERIFFRQGFVQGNLIMTLSTKITSQLRAEHYKSMSGMLRVKCQS